MSKILLSPDFYLGPHYTKDVINMVPDASSLSPQSKWLGTGKCPKPEQFLKAEHLLKHAFPYCNRSVYGPDR